jgi:formate hydrogenlyase subunit 6/NADH:ubiquinone oxidoreductase subunit I
MKKESLLFGNGHRKRIYISCRIIYTCQHKPETIHWKLAQLRIDICRDLMKPGIVSKKEVKGNLVLERSMLGTHQVLRLTRDRCIGCNICAEACPQQAIDLLSPVIKDGRLLKSRTADFDRHKCTFCGVCVVLCPSSAIEIETNGKKSIGVVESKVFPTLLREIRVDVSKCGIECNCVCQDSCPTEAIEVVLKGNEKAESIVIEQVDVNRDLCVFCGECESACPKGAIKVTRPFSGFVKLNAAACPENCQICVDACPTRIIKLGVDGNLSVDERFCIYCSACEAVCPEKIISVTRTGVLHSDISSGAWITALEKLTSRVQMVKELSAKACEKTREAGRSLGRF